MGGQSDGKGPIRITADWKVPEHGPSGAVVPAQYGMISTFDIDWLNTPGFQRLLDNLAASPGAFSAVRVMKALNSGTAEFGPRLNAPNASPPVIPDSVWSLPSSASAPPTSPSFFLANGTPGPTLTALTELTKRGLTPFVVLGFFPAGVYQGTDLQGTSLPATSPYGPSFAAIGNPTATFDQVVSNWTTLVTAFFAALQKTFGKSIANWWFEVWNEPDNSDFWLPDNTTSGQNTLQYYQQLYTATLAGIAAAKLSVPVRVGGPAIMANNNNLTGQTNIASVLPIFLDFIYDGGNSPLQCDFISLHAKGDWTEFQLPNLPTVIKTVEAAFATYADAKKYSGHFHNKPIFNDEADMRLGASVPFYPRMTEQFAAWLTALMIASDSLSAQYRPSGTPFYSCSDNGHLELVGFQEGYNLQTKLPSGTFGVRGDLSFGQQRSIMMPASAWNAGGLPGTSTPPLSPQDLVKVPVYNFYEVVRLLGNQHGAFVSGQQNFYPTDPSSGLFSAVTVGTASGQLTYVTWVFCVYPTDAADLPTTGPIATPLQGMPAPMPLEVIDLPTTPAWTSINWVQFQIGPPGDPTKPVGAANPGSSFVAAQKGQIEALPKTGQTTTSSGMIWTYDMPFFPGQVDLTNSNFSAATVRMNQEMPLVRYMRGEKLPSPGTWQSPAAVDFAPYSTTVFWLTPYDKNWQPAQPTPIKRTLPGNGTETVQVATAFKTMAGDTDVVLRWQWSDTSEQAGSFFYFEVQRVVAPPSGGTTTTIISPTPEPGDDLRLQFALRAAMWVDTAVNKQVPAKSKVHYLVTAFSASGTPSTALVSNAVAIA
jgi:Glycosyl hydrolases family 39